MKALSVAAIAVALAGGAMPAEAGWRDYVGKTVVAVVDMELHMSTREVGDPSPPVLSSTVCIQHTHAYVSSRGRLFFYTPVSQCDGGEPFRLPEPSGMVFDLTVAQGTYDSEYVAGSYTVMEIEGGFELTLPNEDRIIEDENARSVFTQSTGGTTIVLQFAPECGIEWSSETGYRFDYRSKSSDYRSFEETTSTGVYKSISCEIVEGFR